MKIRLAKEEDSAAIARLHRQTIRNVNSRDYPEDLIQAWSARSKAEKLRKSAPKYKRWVAIEDNKIVGFVDHKLNGEFGGLYVHKDYLGKGVGSRLLKTTEESLKKMGFEKITLKATITARDFYKKQGYKVVKKGYHSLGNKKLSAFVMTKKIS